MAKRRVLIVEDDDSMRRGIVDALEFAGFATFEAATGDDGARMMAARDERMGGRGGRWEAGPQFSHMLGWRPFCPESWPDAGQMPLVEAQNEIADLRKRDSIARKAHGGRGCEFIWEISDDYP